MQFRRVLKQKFIDELNNLYEDRNSWWRKIADDDEVFILIRNNRLHVLANGGLLLQVEHTRGSITCKTHEEFLSLRSENNPYVVLEEDQTSPIQRVQGLSGLANHYQKVKRRIKLFTGREKQVVQDLGLGITQIIDLEVGLAGRKRRNATRRGARRIDMAGISDEGMLVFFEVKLFDNSEIRSPATPKVVRQLQEYERLLKKFQREILNGYNEQFKMYERLNGNFFRKRIPKINEFELHPRVRLIITDFDGIQRTFLLPKFMEGISQGLGWSVDSPDLITVGKHRIIKKSRLFKGL